MRHKYMSGIHYPGDKLQRKHIDTAQIASVTKEAVRLAYIRSRYETLLTAVKLTVVFITAAVLLMIVMRKI